MRMYVFKKEHNSFKELKKILEKLEKTTKIQSIDKLYKKLLVMNIFRI